MYSTEIDEKVREIGTGPIDLAVYNGISDAELEASGKLSKCHC